MAHSGRSDARSPDAAPLAASAAVLGRKWHPVILRLLLDEPPLGFADLEAALDVSRKVLSESLTDLQEKGVVERTVLDENPTRVEYALTDRGRGLEDAVDELDRWGREYLDDRADPPEPGR